MQNGVAEAYPVRQGFGWELTAAFLCFLSGLALVANVHPIGDGLWFWYGDAVLDHQRLYTDLHLNLQPLFVLLTAAFQALLGRGWLASKALAALQLLAYCWGLLLVSRFIPWKSWQRGLLILGSFCMTVTTSFYRFDDYHITTQCFQIYSIYLLLLLWRAVTPARTLALAGVLGVLSGLSTVNRLNDGAALFVGCVLALPFLAGWRRGTAVLVFCAAVPLAMLVVLACTGDSLHAWAMESIFHAARIKGGTGSVLLSPLFFLVHISRYAVQKTGLPILLGPAAAFYLFARYPDSLRQGQRLRSTTDRLLMAFLVLLTLLFLWRGTEDRANLKLGQFLALLLLGLGVWVHVRLFRAALSASREAWNRLQVLLLIPFWALLASAMTSGSNLPDYEPNVALLLLIAPLAWPWRADRQWQRRGWLVMMSLVTVGAIPAKALVPYAWHHFHARPMFAGRTWYKHPVYGPMMIEKDQLGFMLPICQAVHAGGGSATLLSLPYPYPNYFCDIEPWHGYVQTWYDTSSQQRIEALMQELDQAPPEWIVYQRALDTMDLHEKGYANGRLLPHRELDRLILQKVVTDRWTVSRRSCFGGADWLLIHTTPPSGQDHRGTPSDAADRWPACEALYEAERVKF